MCNVYIYYVGLAALSIIAVLSVFYGVKFVFALIDLFASVKRIKENYVHQYKQERNELLFDRLEERVKYLELKNPKIKK